MQHIEWLKSRSTKVNCLRDLYGAALLLASLNFKLSFVSYCGASAWTRQLLIPCVHWILNSWVQLRQYSTMGQSTLQLQMARANCETIHPKLITFHYWMMPPVPPSSNRGENDRIFDITLQFKKKKYQPLIHSVIDRPSRWTEWPLNQSFYNLLGWKQSHVVFRRLS